RGRSHKKYGVKRALSESALEVHKSKAAGQSGQYYCREN
ncbi:hypothetical protein Tco_0587402, partial [Tanacetum coccineum]